MCDCEQCKLSRKVQSIRELLINLGQSEQLANLDDLYSQYVHDSLDHDWLKAVVDNQWPSAESVMKGYGWVREVKDEN